MDSRQVILNLLRKQKTISGKKLGVATGISRSAVWKHIKALQDQGYCINSTPGTGYSLVDVPDQLLPMEICSGLDTQILGKKIIYYQELASTQEKAVELAKQGYPEGTLVIAEEQTAGKGRLGRKWEASPGSISFSIIFRPNLSPGDIMHFPLASGIAVARTIEHFTGELPGLKWPNDILISGKKIAGILTEVAAEPDRLHYLILGIGINLNTEQSAFNKDLQSRASSLFALYGQRFSRPEFLRVLLMELENIHKQYNKQGFSYIRENWKDLNITLGRKVTLRDQDRLIQGIAEDINSQGGLVLTTDSREKITVTSGDLLDHNTSQ